MSEFTVFLDFVTSATFVVAPLIATLNYLVVTRCDLPEAARPSPLVRTWAVAAIVVMTALAAMFFVLTLA